MTHYSVQPRDRVFVKGYGFLSFAKNMIKNISKILSGKYSQKLHDHTKQSATDALKTASKRVIQKTEVAGDLIGNKIADKITTVSKTSPQNTSEINKDEISPELRQKINHDLRLKDKRQKIIDDLRLI